MRPERLVTVSIVVVQRLGVSPDWILMLSGTRVQKVSRGSRKWSLSAQNVWVEDKSIEDPFRLLVEPITRWVLPAPRRYSTSLLMLVLPLRQVSEALDIRLCFFYNVGVKSIRDNRKTMLVMWSTSSSIRHSWSTERLAASG